jgi:hypothetical protein
MRSVRGAAKKDLQFLFRQVADVVRASSSWRTNFSRSSDILAFPDRHATYLLFLAAYKRQPTDTPGHSRMNKLNN